jgi:GntR family transcriptional regulator, transcriptional repressor for pyruvate dehydrogenase complex
MEKRYCVAQRRTARLAKASDVIVTALRDRILYDRLPVGSPLPGENELMEQFGLGRVTVRESLRLLERDGIIEIRRGPMGGVYTGSPDVMRLSEVFTVLLAMRDTRVREFVEFRWLVEPEAARLAALNATEEQRAALQHAIRNEGKYFGQTVDVHAMIAEASGNSVLALSFQAIHDSFVHQHRDSFVRPVDVEGTRKAHAKIVSHIVEGRADEAEAAMRKHLRAYEERMVETGLIDEDLVPRSADAAEQSLHS